MKVTAKLAEPIEIIDLDIDEDTLQLWGYEKARCAKWVLSESKDSATCSVCGDKHYFLYNYCPNCGAEMVGYK